MIEAGAVVLSRDGGGQLDQLAFVEMTLERVEQFVRDFDTARLGNFVIHLDVVDQAVGPLRLLRRWRNPAQNRMANGLHLCVSGITPYFRRISIVRSRGKASTVWPLPVIVIARKSEL